MRWDQILGEWKTADGEEVVINRTGEGIVARVVTAGRVIEYAGRFGGARLTLEYTLELRDFTNRTPLPLRRKLVGRVKNFYELTLGDDGLLRGRQFGDRWTFNGNKLVAFHRRGSAGNTETWTRDAALDLRGYWRIHGGAGDSWLVVGERSPDGGYAFRTAPTQAIAGSWKGGNIDMTARASSPRGALSEKVTPPGPLTALTNAGSGSVSSGRALSGVPAGIEEDVLTVAREEWAVQIVDDGLRTTRFFDPAEDPDEPALVKLERVPRNLVPSRPDSLAASARILDARGTEIAATGDDPADLDEPLSVRVAETNGPNGQVRWTGATGDGSMAPTGTYRLEVTVRDGMAETTVEHKVLLGQGFRIVSVPDHFAPGKDDVVVRYECVPEEVAPTRVDLRLFSGDRRELTGRLGVTPQGIGNGQFEVTFAKKATEAIDWAADGPLQIEVSGVSTADGEELVDRAELRVVPVEIQIEVAKVDVSKIDTINYYQKDEVPADEDVPDLVFDAKVIVLDVSGERVDALGVPDLEWNHELNPEPDQVPPGQKPGFYRPDAAEVVPEATRSAPLREGRVQMRYRPPRRAERYDRDEGRVEPGDEFEVTARLKDLGDGPVGRTQTFTVVHGAPDLERVRQLDIEEIFDLFGKTDKPSDEFFPSVPIDSNALLGSVAAKAAKDAGVGGLEDALNSSLAQAGTKTLRSIGDVGGLPGRPSSAPLELHVAGYAGDSIDRLGGGQALLVVVEVEDSFGNAVPLVQREGRPPLAELIADNEDAGGDRDQVALPPFVVKNAAAGGRSTFAFGGDTTMNAFGQSSDQAPPGLAAFYYVPGYEFAPLTGGQDPEDVKNFAEYLNGAELGELRWGNGQAEDDRLRLGLRYRGEDWLLENSSITLFRGEPPESALTKWMRWLVAGEVSDLQTLDAELLFSTIPFAGDLRDLVITALKGMLSNDGLDYWDTFFASLALLGLALDAASFAGGAGLPANAAVAALKATAKLVKNRTRDAAAAARGMSKAFRIVFDDVKKFAKAGDLNGLIRQYERFFELLRRGNADDLTKRLKRISDFVDTCNPQTCLRAFLRWLPEHSEIFLKRHDDDTLRAMKSCLEKVRGQKKVDELFSLVRTIGDNLEGISGNLSRKAFGNLMSAIANAPDEKQIEALITALAAVKKPVLREAAPAFGRKVFVDAADESPEVLGILAERLGKRDGRATARVLRGVTKGARKPDIYRDLATLLNKNVSRAVRTLDAWLEPNLLRDRGGEAGLRRAIGALAELAEQGKKSAERTLRVFERVFAQPLIRNRENLLFTDLAELNRKLGPGSTASYMEALDYFLTNARRPIGLIARSSQGTIPNLLAACRSARPTNEALEVVGTWALLRNGRTIDVVVGDVVGGGLPQKLRIKLSDIDSFGWKDQLTPNAKKTIEADTLIQLQLDSSNGQPRFVEIVLDWKNKRKPGANSLAEKDLRKALNALADRPVGPPTNRTGPPVDAVLFLTTATQGWTTSSQTRVRAQYQKPGFQGLILATVSRTEELARFLAKTTGF